MPTLSNPELAEAIEGANNLILRWGHGQMRQINADEMARIVAALKAFASSERADTVAVRRSLAERTEAMFRSVDPTGQLAVEWKQTLQSERPRGG